MGRAAAAAKWEAWVRDGHLRVYNYAGFADVIDCATGGIVHSTFTK